MLVKSTSDWVRLEVRQEQEKRAQALRAERDARYSNIFAQSATDVRWVGDLGELVLDEWMRESGVNRVQWQTDDAAGKADFVSSSGVSVGAKTVKRQQAPRLDYTAQITARHAKEPSDWFFFMNYSLDRRTLWLLGAIESTRFLAEATYYGAGDRVHENYVIRPGHEIWNLDLTRLYPPRDWLHWMRQA